MIFYFICYLLHRFLSGLRNGMIYREGWPRAAQPLLLSVGGMWVFVALAYMMHVVSRYQWPMLSVVSVAHLNIAAIIAAVLCCACSAVALCDIKGADLHTWTTAEQALLSGMFLLFGPQATIAAVLAVYPAVVVQKITINLFSGLEWNHHGTDDPTGNTYGLPLFGTDIQVPRLGFNTRLWFAAISIIALLVLHIFA